MLSKLTNSLYLIPFHRKSMYFKRKLTWISPDNNEMLFSLSNYCKKNKPQKEVKQCVMKVDCEENKTKLNKQPDDHLVS